MLGLPPGSYMTAMESICYRPRSTDTLLEQLTPMPQWLRPAVSVGRAAMRGECSAVDTVGIWGVLTKVLILACIDLDDMTSALLGVLCHFRNTEHLFTPIRSHFEVTFELGISFGEILTPCVMPGVSLCSRPVRAVAMTWRPQSSRHPHSRR